MKRITLFLLVVLFLTGIAWALEIGGKILPDKMKAGDTELMINGAGLRKKLIIKVYAGALYLPEKCSDAAKIVADDVPMAVKMHFIYRKVEPEKLIEAWNAGFAKSDISNLSQEIATFNSFFKEDAKKDDVYDIIYIPEEGTSFYINGNLIGTVAGYEFKKALFGIWFSDATELPGLRDAMLGK
ncbi:MAG: chalcone isomerase family protein [Candidatus Cloacimonadales bacterium]|nr:chalcone isomerase family protein [Candidatus Cloacimonadales bacterium]